MTADRWDQVQSLFHAALDRPAAERRGFLESACDDPTLVDAVEALLDEDAVGHPLFEGGRESVARDVLREPEAEPRRLGPYRVLGVLGEGGMGVVYLAERDDIGARAAIKVLRDATLSPARRERFEREEQILAGLHHPAIAQLYDADVLPDGTPYFVMECVDGVPVTDYCETHGCPVAERLRLFRAVCEAVGYAHRQAVVHRDIKPSNVLVAEGDGGAARVKLLDFGIAKVLDDVDVPADQTVTGLRLMTPAYAAPEQLRGHPVGVFTDVYALGVLLYEILTETRPFDLTGRSAGEAETLILEQEPQAPSARVGDARRLGKRAWADLDVLCLTAMHKDPERRYASVEALVRDLDHFLAGEPLEARPDSFGYRAGTFVRRNRQPVAAAAVVLVAAIGLVAFYTVRLAAARDAALAEAAKAEQVSEYLISLFDASDPFGVGTDSLTVAALLARGEERAEDLADQPAAQAEMLDALGRVHVHLSQYGRGDTLLHRALALRRSAGDSLGVAETLANLGVLHSASGEYDRAEGSLREALAIRERHLPPRHPDLATTLDILGTALNRNGEYEEAEAVYRRALRLQRDLYDEPHADLSSTLNNLAVNLFDQGDYEAAEHYFREGMTVSRAVYGPDHPSTAVDLGNLGVLLDTRGNYAAADSALTEALRIKRLHLGDDHYETAFTLTQLGGMLRRKGDLDHAETLLREARAIEERVLPPDHRNTAVTLNHLALTLQDRGDYDAAEPLLRRVVAIFEESVGAEHPYTAVGTCHLAHLLALRGDVGQAEALFRDGLAVLDATLPADHDIQALNNGKYGEMLVAQSRFDEAEPLLLTCHEQLRDRFGSDHPDTRKARARLVALYETWGKPEQAARFRERRTTAGT